MYSQSLHDCFGCYVIESTLDLEKGCQRKLFVFKSVLDRTHGGVDRTARRLQAVRNSLVDQY